MLLVVLPATGGAIAYWQSSLSLVKLPITGPRADLLVGIFASGTTSYRYLLDCSWKRHLLMVVLHVTVSLPDTGRTTCY